MDYFFSITINILLNPFLNLFSVYFEQFLLSFITFPLTINSYNITNPPLPKAD